MTSSGARRRSLLATAALFVFRGVISTADAFQQSNNTMYASNATHILLLDSSGGNARPVYRAATGGRIVGLAYSLTDNLLFWSDIGRSGSRGIYSALTDTSGAVLNSSLIVSDVLEVNGLTVDWVAKNIYWTDGRKRTIEVAKFTGANRRVLFIDLNQPRGIYADPVNSWLFWNDQGTHLIERSRLDGSARAVFISNYDTNSLPNQMVASGSTLYWVDSNDKSLRSAVINADGSSSNIQTVSLSSAAGTNHVFGLAVSGNYAYVTCWSATAQLLKVTLSTGSVTVTGSTLSQAQSMFSAVYVSSGVQPPVSNRPCSCLSSQLCLPKEAGNYRCSCPSYGGQTMHSGTCQTPTNILLYALADSGYVGFYDPTADNNSDIYIVGRSLRPVAVAYDIYNQYVYWSDVREKTIHRSKLDGSSSVIYLDSSDGIGIVDGMAVDPKGRRLIYTNIGSMSIDDKTYSWHKVESANIDGYPVKVRTIVSSIADKPRAVAIDVDNALLYYTDWGSKASIVRSKLDGSNPVVIKTGLYNPNGLVLGAGSTLYFVDSNFKTRNANLGAVMNGSLYSIDTSGNNLQVDVLSGAQTKLNTPYGVAWDAAASKVYVSDWSTGKIMALTQPQQVATVVQTGSTPMALFYTAVTASPRPSWSGSCSTCGDICLPNTASLSTCTCNSYVGRALASGSTSCSLPTGYLLVSDMDGVKLVSLDGSTDAKSVYVTAPGRPFYSNYVALTFDPASGTAYYSDLASKAIYALNMVNSTSTEFYRVNHVIDGLTLYNGQQLYWTDSRNGLIARLQISPKGSQHETLLTGLSRPRAIKIYNNYIYWTEWGSNPRVARMLMPNSGSSNSVEQLPVTGLLWPNALYFSGDRMYVADGHPTRRQLLNCNVDGTGCQPVSGVNSTTVQHMYDIYIANNILYYTDWKTSSVGAFNLNTGIALQPIASGLMRPAQMYFVISGSSSSGSGGTPGASSTTCAQSTLSCSSGCVQLLGTQQCNCNSGTAFDSSMATCVASSSVCSGGYSYGTVYQPPSQPCLSCQCLPSRLYADNRYFNTTCETTSCPAAACSNPTIPSGQCCPVCPGVTQCTTINITNCPTAVHLVLPDTAAQILYDYEPTVDDCRGLSRTYTVTRSPVNNLYGLGSPVTVSVTVTATSGPADTDSCQYSVSVTDVTAPTIRCPADVHVYTDSSSSNTASKVQWRTSPTFNDNAGRPTVSAQPAWGSDFTVGSTVVTYTAADAAGNTATCSFNVIVTSLPQPPSGGTQCKIPRLQHGDIVCSVQSSTFSCAISCDAGYQRSNTGVLTCSGGQWDRDTSGNFESNTCHRVTAGSAQGTVGVTAKKACKGSPILEYTNTVLQGTLENRYRSYSPKYPLRYVVLSECKLATRRRRDTTAVYDLPITVTVSGDYQNETERYELQTIINFILDDIKKNLGNGFIEIVVRDANSIWTADNVVVNPAYNSSVLVGFCPPGAVKDSSVGLGCVYCTPGTYQNGSTCFNCSVGYYSDQDGQTSCYACPSGKTTIDPGAYIDQLCVVPNSTTSGTTPGTVDSKTAIIIGVVVGVGGGLLIIAIIIITVVCVKKHRNKKAGNGAAGGGGCKAAKAKKRCDEYTNEIYDEIADDVSPSPTPSGAAKSTQNTYQTLPHHDAGENQYDKIVEKPEYDDQYEKPVYEKAEAK